MQVDPSEIHDLVYVARAKAQEVMPKRSLDWDDNFRRVDEMAVLFRNAAESILYEQWLQEEGWETAGRDHDTVSTAPIVSRYDVGYRWLTNSRHEWRYELMTIGQGFSPLHHAALHDGGTGFIMHASFKCVNEDDYDVACRDLVYRGMQLAQSCVSGYGKFSYYTDSTDPLPVYLKPRINLRDAS